MGQNMACVYINIFVKSGMCIKSKFLRYTLYLRAIILQQQKTTEIVGEKVTITQFSYIVTLHVIFIIFILGFFE